MKLNLPIFSNDVLRTEVLEDTGSFSREEYFRERNKRLKNVLSTGNPFIYDASIDRAWRTAPEFKGCEKFKYRYFIISLDLSKNFLRKLYKLKKYNESLKALNRVVREHKEFLEKYGDDVNLHINDKQFAKRLTLSYRAVSRWLTGVK